MVDDTSLTQDARLAVAAAHGDPAAIAELERDVMPVAAAALRAIGIRPSACDEVLQRVRELLLVGRGEGRPRLLDYGARGPLRAWVRIVAVREGLQTFRVHREVSLGDAMLASMPDADDDPELRYLRGEARGRLAGALTRALAELTPRERGLLRYTLIDGLALDEIAAIHGTHKSTISRWLARARQRLWERARELLAAELAGDASQLSSLVRSLRSGLDLSLERLLAQ